jgi:site-specific DNA recombinase
MIVALYARVSTTRQAEKDLSIPDQLRQMREWSKARSYQVVAEYVEPGASATDDRRPVFQQMIADACTSPPPFDAIMIHSLSRFFRDMIEFALYERRLKKHGVIILSITQQTSDDPAGEMARRIFSLFDEYQSKENAKHTLRAMKENARQGYFNGSTAPYGFRAVEVEHAGNKGKKKRLEIDPSEATVINTIYRLYLEGYEGQDLGVKGIAAYLNSRGFTMRRGKFRKTIISKIIASRIYCGEYAFNKRDSHTLKIKPESEWVTMSLPPIVDEETFQRVARRRFERTASNTPARVVNTPTLLTGLVRCGLCGSLMTIATGKGGRYRYYKCTSKINIAGKKECENSNVRMETLDRLVLQTMADKVFTYERVEKMVEGLKVNLKKASPDHDEDIRRLTKELEDTRQQTERLYEAVEKGLFTLNESLHERVHRHEARRQEILTELARLRHQKEMPVTKLSKKNIMSFCCALKEMLLDRTSQFGKQYMRLLLDEIRVIKKEVHLRGSYAALASALSSGSSRALNTVPSFVPYWLPSADSNHGPDG